MILHFDSDGGWIEVIRNWAEQKPEVYRVSMFGSRVTGIRTPKDPPKIVPDLDLAIELAEGQEGRWFEQSDWKAELGALLPVEVDCQWSSPTETPTVASYLGHGSLVVFERDS